MEEIDIEKVEVKNLGADIRKTCYEIFHKPNLVKTNSDKVYENFIDNIDNNEIPNEDQEILLERKKGNLSDRFFYINLSNHFTIEVFKNLSEEQIYTQNEEDFSKLFTGIRTLKKKNRRDFIETKKGDIVMTFKDSSLTDKISEDNDNKKIGMYLLGEDAFINMSIPGSRDEEDYQIIPATQNDLIAILEAIKKLV